MPIGTGIWNRESDGCLRRMIDGNETPRGLLRGVFCGVPGGHMGLTGRVFNLSDSGKDTAAFIVCRFLPLICRRAHLLYLSVGGVE